MQDHTAPWAGAKTRVIEAVSLTEVDRLGALIVHHLPLGVTFGLIGTLGAGKTRLTQAIAGAVEIDQADVTSPTFTLLQTHRGQFRQQEFLLHHLDAYRIEDEDEFEQLGVDELFEDEQAWTIVEWADRVPFAMPVDTLWIRILIGTRPDERRIVFADPTNRFVDSLQSIQSEFDSSDANRVDLP